jgi:hypothetical protein
MSEYRILEWNGSEQIVRDMTPEEIAALPTPEELAEAARADRNARLAACDWTQLSDAQCDQTAWAAYRQSLREVSEQPGFPRVVVWPTPPR